MGCLTEASKSTTGQRCPSQITPYWPLHFQLYPRPTNFQFLPSPTLNHQQQLYHGDSHRAPHHTLSHTTPPPPPLTLRLSPPSTPKDRHRHRQPALETLSDIVTSGLCRLLALPFCLTLAAVGQVRQHVQPRHQRDVCCCGAALYGWERGPARSSQEGHPRRHEF